MFHALVLSLYMSYAILIVCNECNIICCSNCVDREKKKVTTCLAEKTPLHMHYIYTLLYQYETQSYKHLVHMISLQLYLIILQVAQKPTIWWRYIDDILSIWPHGKDNFKMFLIKSVLFILPSNLPPSGLYHL